jgi:hypothetical protein
MSSVNASNIYPLTTTYLQSHTALLTNVSDLIETPKEVVVCPQSRLTAGWQPIRNQEYVVEGTTLSLLNAATIVVGEISKD